MILGIRWSVVGRSCIQRKSRAGSKTWPTAYSKMQAWRWSSHWKQELQRPAGHPGCPACCAEKTCCSVHCSADFRARPARMTDPAEMHSKMRCLVGAAAWALDCLIWPYAQPDLGL